MKIIQLKGLLESLASNDLSDDSSIDDHPCMVAVRALDQSFEDIEILRRVIINNPQARSKKVTTLIKLNYDPSW